ncbi:MAG: outer membrane lipid asymmetry maintenance protein MlaD [Gammaproteobacteria bacterium]
MRQRSIEMFVGLFLLLAIVGFVFLAFKVSGLTTAVFHRQGYTVTAAFDNIGGLKVRSPVTMAGVKIGSVEKIDLDPVTFQGIVTLFINDSAGKIPDDSTASILTQGLLGSNYIGITPGYSEQFLKLGSVIENTHPALILENIIGQFLFSINKKDASSGSANTNTSTTTNTSNTQ